MFFLSLYLSVSCVGAAITKDSFSERPGLPFILPRLKGKLSILALVI